MEITDTLEHEDFGYLTAQEFARARWAYDYAVKFLPWLRVAGYVSFEAEDVRVDSSGGSPIGIPGTKLAYIEISRILVELNVWASVEVAAQDEHGADMLRLLGREMGTAVHRWPMEERPHKIVDMRCGGCGLLTLMYRPPRWEGDEVKADCSQRCGFELVGDELALSVAILEQEEIERQKAAKTA